VRGRLAKRLGPPGRATETPDRQQQRCAASRTLASQGPVGRSEESREPGDVTNPAATTRSCSLRSSEDRARTAPVEVWGAAIVTAAPGPDQSATPPVHRHGRRLGRVVVGGSSALVGPMWRRQHHITPADPASAGRVVEKQLTSQAMLPTGSVSLAGAGLVARTGCLLRLIGDHGAVVIVCLHHEFSVRQRGILYDCGL